jgi:hypothetical protein
MRVSILPLAAISTLSSTAAAATDCQNRTLQSTRKLHYTIDPTYIIFPLEAPFKDFISTIQSSTLKTIVGADTTTIVKDLFGAPCTITIRAHSTPNITTSQLGLLFSTSMDDTELFCHSASVKIHNLVENRHTMLSRHFKAQIAQPGAAVGEFASVEYWVSCPVAPESVREERDCGFCSRVKSELEGVCELRGLGKIVDEIGVGFGDARCEGC